MENQEQKPFYCSFISSTKTWFAFLGWLIILSIILHVAFNVDFSTDNLKESSQLLGDSDFSVVMTVMLLQWANIVLKIVAFISILLIVNFLWVTILENRFYNLFLKRFTKGNVARILIHILMMILFILLIGLGLNSFLIALSLTL